VGKKNRLREARRREAEKRFSAVLGQTARFDARSRAPLVFLGFEPEWRKRVEALRNYALRAPEDWRCRIKSRLQDRRFIDLVRFTFARYRVAPHLERVWIDEIADDFVDRVTLPRPAEQGRRGAPDLRRWYVVAAQGGSLYRQEAHPYLSRRETHHFLTAPPTSGWPSMRSGTRSRAHMSTMAPSQRERGDDCQTLGARARPDLGVAGTVIRSPDGATACAGYDLSIALSATSSAPLM
jgi:hypothetical protein